MLADDIRSNITASNQNVVMAVHEVTEAEKYQEGTRNKLIWLAACCAVMIIAVVVIVVVVVQMKKK
jgi:t-SNARE complex subunit (syntaxin)